MAWAPASAALPSLFSESEPLPCAFLDGGDRSGRTHSRREWATERSWRERARERGRASPSERERGRARGSESERARAGPSEKAGNSASAGEVHRVVRRPLPRCRPARPRTVSAARHPHADDTAHLAAALHRRVSSWPRDANVAAMAAQQGWDWTPLGIPNDFGKCVPGAIGCFLFLRAPKRTFQNPLGIGPSYGSDCEIF